MAQSTYRTRDQVISVLRQAGWEDELIPWYLAVTKAESSWRPRALNDNPTTGDLSYGDGQINMIGKLGVERRAKYGINNEDLYDPLINATIARNILHEQGPDAWSTARGGKIPFPNFDHRASYQRPQVFNQGMTIGTQGVPGAAYGATNNNDVSVGDLFGAFSAPFRRRDLPNHEDDVRFAAAAPFVAATERIFGTSEQQSLPSQPAQLALNTTSSDLPAGDTRTIAIGKYLSDQGYTPWQHTNFDVSKGHIVDGGARVWQRPYESDHNTAEGALDFPLSHNTPEQLATLNNYLDQNRKALGVKSLLWGVPGHKDHLHVAFHPLTMQKRIG